MKPGRLILTALVYTALGYALLYAATTVIGLEIKLTWATVIIAGASLFVAGKAYSLVMSLLRIFGLVIGLASLGAYLQFGLGWDLTRITSFF